jgi:hypothetical protein
LLPAAWDLSLVLALERIEIDRRHYSRITIIDAKTYTIFLAAIALGRGVNVKYSFHRDASKLVFPAIPTFHHEKFVITDATTGAELQDLNLDASVAESDYVIDKKAISGCGIAIRRNQTKEE